MDLLYVISAMILFAPSLAHSDVNCLENEVYRSRGSTFPPTCQNKNITTYSDQSEKGCFCQKGYIREGPGGRCVKSCENVPICEGREVFSNCTSRCQRTCDDSNNTMACPAVCMTGCACPEYYVRERKGGPCIPEVSCKTKCDKNEVYRECGSLCPPTCFQPNRGCPKICANGCFCKDPYVLDDDSRKCVKKTNCLKSDE